MLYVAGLDGRQQVRLAASAGDTCPVLEQLRLCCVRTVFVG